MNTVLRPTEELPLLDDASRRRAGTPRAAGGVDDDTLVRAAAAGDTAAFGQLVRRHDDKMRGVVWRIVGSGAAMDDVLQEAYLKAWRALDGYRRDSAFSTWLYTIVHRTALDWMRSQRRLRLAPEGELPEHLLHDAAGTASRTSASRDHASGVTDSLALQQALAELSPDHLAVVTLIDGEGHSYDDVATLLDISPGTVASRLSRARAELRARLTISEAAPGEDLR